ncbi:MAG: hypothetical protein CMH58_03995 [Myxococcales bacterium]|nr:hypothetical protein [Myxococcales bacterium]
MSHNLKLILHKTPRCNRTLFLIPNTSITSAKVIGQKMLFAKMQSNRRVKITLMQFIITYRHRFF